jgi:dCTP deaminase
MILRAEKIVALLERGKGEDADPLVMTPTPDLETLRKSGTASVDVRLGTWFASLKQTSNPSIRIDQKDLGARITKTHFIPFGEEFILHPNTFVLAVTLEWIRLPTNLAAYVVGKSSWGRCGLIIATATGVHPGFFGCLTLELSNVGEIPIAVKPGYPIGQLFLHTVEHANGDGATPTVSRSTFGGSRRPLFKTIKLDPFAERLAKADKR